MVQQITASLTPTGQHGASLGPNTVISLESARRRRSGQSVSGDAIRVLVVGSHALTRAGLRRLLDDEGGVAVVGEAATGLEGARLVSATEPHVVLLDAGCLEPDPAASARVLGGRIPILLLAECDADDRLLAALRAGATGVLAKDSRPAELASAVRTLAGGGALLPPHTTRRLIRELVDTTATPR